MRQKIDALRVHVCTLVFLLCISGSLMAQKKVTGIVTNAKDKSPVAFATVTVKGTNIATVTSVVGAFTLTLPSGRNIIVVSNVGFDDAEIDYSSKDNADVVLREKSASLDEIVVTGYTTQKKKNIAGSVAIVNVKEMKAVPGGSVDNLLQGRASGLTVISSGNPGEASQIRIRGIASFGGANPLVMVDGTPGNLNDINPNDIESISVLKDAGSAAIYGVSGGAGVILITTKRGKAGKAQVSYDAYLGTQRPPQGNVFNLLNTAEMGEAIWLSLRNSNQLTNGNPFHPQYGNSANPTVPDYILPAGVSEGAPGTDPSLYNIDFNRGAIYQITRANKTGTDWFHEIFSPAPIQSHSIQATGGSDKSSYLFSVQYFNQQGTLLNTYLKRYSTRINTTFNVKDNIRVGENAFIYARDNPRIGNQSEGNEISMTYREQPIIPVYDINGGYAGTRAPGLGNAQNPVATRVRAKDDKGNEWMMQGNIFGEIDFARHFTARTQFGGSLQNGYYYFYGYRTYENAENNGSNSFSENAYYNRSWAWLNTIRYNNVFGEDHAVNVLFGTEALSYYGRGVGGNRLGYFTDLPDYRILSSGNPTGQTNSSYAYQEARFSLIGQIDYTYRDKYILGFRARRDGSSRFGNDSRYGNFPAVSVAWRVSKESFMAGVSWVNELKLKGSWGKLGALSNTPPENQYDLFGGGPGDAYYDINGTSTSTVQGFRAARIGNPKTGWEENVTTNIGLDAQLFNSKVDFSIEWYSKSINGLLFTAPALDVAGGASRPFINIGDINNKGIDMSFTYHGNISRDWRFDANLIFTHYKTNVVNIPGDYFDAGGSRIGNFVRNQTGNPISAFFGYKVVGLFQDAADVQKSPTQNSAAPGRFKYQDTDGSGTITDADRTFFGNPNPDFTYGLNLTLMYKNFDFSMFLYGSQGNDVINYVRYWTDFYPSFQGVKSQDLLYKSWTPQRTNTSTPIAENDANFSNNQVVNSYYLEDGSYLRCRQMQLGYNFSSKTLEKAKINKMRLYIQAANLFTFTNYTGLDPELNGSNSAFGIDFGNYPNNQRNFLIGLNVNF